MTMYTSRRKFIFGSMLAALPSSPNSAAPVPNWPASLPPLDGLIKVRNRAGGGRVFWHYEGDFYGKVHNERAVPLMRIEGASISRFVRRGDGAYEWSLVEAGYFVDRESGDVLDDWENPLTGAVVQPRHYKSRQRAVMKFIGPAGFQPLGVTMTPDMEFRGDLSGPIIHGDVVWFGEELFLHMPSSSGETSDPGTPSVRVATSLATWQASLSDVLDTSRDFAPSTLSYTTINSWRPWMGMGETPGVISWRLLGSKHQDHDEIPDRLVNRIERDHSGFFESNR